MSQITSGLRSILSNPFVYSSFQRFMGAKEDRKNFVDNFVRPVPDMKVLDIGCGPADVLEYLSDIHYHGFDISQVYIDQADKKFGHRGHFQCKQLEMSDLENLPSFDAVIAIGLLHHLDDDLAVEMLQLAFAALKPGGRLLTLDPCFDPEQNFVARFLVQNDRGRNVRNREGYEKIAKMVFPTVEASVRQKVWIPYTHCLMECQK